MGQYTILVAMDDGEVRTHISEMLMLKGYETLECQDGLEAAEILTWADFPPPDLIICEHHMYAQELIASVRPNHPLLPIIVLSGRWDVREFNGMAYVVVFQEPFHMGAIFATIKRLLSESEAP